MSTTGPDLVRYLRTLASGQANDACTDRQLLEQFVTRREETSFVALIRRHGPMVLGVCRRVLGHEQDAEDAFQATFLVLARKAGSIRKHDSVSSWLHGVAHRIAEKLRAKEVRRAAHERKAASRPAVDPAEDVVWREIRCLLDSELARLPERYRGPLVLCYLQGKTQDEAARQLGWSLRTFRRRLQCARDLLTRRLTRRGVTLSAALSAPLLADAATQAALSPLLIASTVRAGLASATGQTTGALISVQVESLARFGVGSLLTKKASIAVVLLLSLIVGIGGLLAYRAVPGGTRAEAPAAPPPQFSVARNDSKDHVNDINGRVLDPDGKPFAGARLFLLANATQEKPDVIVRARTDKEGRFHVTAKPAIFNPKGKTTLAATANGFGPDWVDLTKENKDAITLRLVKDDVPIRGRVLDLEGKPVAGATVRVLDLHQIDLDWWLENEKRGFGYSPKRGHIEYKSIKSSALDLPAQAITGADGRFQLHGLGRERLVDLLIEGDTIERVHCRGLTRDGKNLNLPKGREPIYPATFDHISAPTKPIIGTVRDKGTGKPLAGIIVQVERQSGRWIDKATTDQQGRYRIVGCPKQPEYTVAAAGSPYFIRTKRKIADTPGLEPLVVDFELERGIEITGRVFNKMTGEPIEAQVAYHALMDNSYLKKVSDLDQGGLPDDGRNRSKADGSFFVIGLPGPGYLTVLAIQDDYRKPERPTDWEKLVPYVIAAPPRLHAWVRITPSEKDPQSLRCDIALEPAKPIPGQVFGSDGKPLGGYFVAGLTGSPIILSNQMELHDKSTFQVRGFDSGRSRPLIFIHPQKELGKVVIVREDQGDPLQVRLESLGAVAGRRLDEEGRPRAGLPVRVQLSHNDDDFLPTVHQFEMGLRFYHLEPTATTDAGGKFRLKGLMPGLKYTLVVGEREIEKITVESGKTKDLGDLLGK